MLRVLDAARVNAGHLGSHLAQAQLGRSTIEALLATGVGLLVQRLRVEEPDGNRGWVALLENAAKKDLAAGRGALLDRHVFGLFKEGQDDRRTLCEAE